MGLNVLCSIEHLHICDTYVLSWNINIEQTNKNQIQSKSNIRCEFKVFNSSKLIIKKFYELQIAMKNSCIFLKRKNEFNGYLKNKPIECVKMSSVG